MTTERTAGMCGGCKRKWRALGQAHCRECHEHFNSTAAFDRHREGSVEEGRYCVRVEDYATPYRKTGLPRLVRSLRADGEVWVTALRDDH